MPTGFNPYTTADAGTHRQMVNLDLSEVSGVDAPANEHPGWMVLKALNTPTTGEKPMPDLNLDALDPEVRAHIETLTTERDAAVAKAKAAEAEADDDLDGGDDVAKGKKAPPFKKGGDAEDAADGGDDEDEEDDVKKALATLPEPLRKHLEDLEARASAAETVAKAEQNRRLDEEFVAKARTLDHLSLDPVEFGPILRRTAEAQGADAVAIFDVLKAANEAVEVAGLTTGIGAAAASATSGSAYGRLEGLAKAKQAAEPNLSTAEAFAQAATENPDLYTAYLKEA